GGRAAAYCFAPPPLRSQAQQIGDQSVLLPLRQIHAENQVEELDRVGERQQAAVVQIGRRVLYAAQGEGLDRAVRHDGEIVDDLLRLVEPFELQIVHIVVHERRLRNVTFRAAAFAQKHALALELDLARLGRIQPAARIELRRR